MSSNTKAFEEKMKSSVEHLDRELAAVRAGRANPAVRHHGGHRCFCLLYTSDAADEG